MDAHLEKQICARIKQARKAAGFTQEDFANLLNVTTRTWQNYERDRVPFRRLGEIARLTSVQQEWLVRGDQKESDPTPVLDRLEELQALVVAFRAEMEQGRLIYTETLKGIRAGIESIDRRLSEASPANSAEVRRDQA